MKKKTRKTNQFKVCSADGRIFDVIEFTDFTENNTFDGRSIIPGQKSYKTSNGDWVNVINKQNGIYQILELDLEVRKIK